MSRHEQVEVTCPECKARGPWTYHSSVNVTLDPKLKGEVLSQRIFNFTCPACRQSTPVHSPLLYHDMQQKLMVQVSPKGLDFDGEAIDAPQRAGGTAVWQMILSITTRVVSTPNELVEKIKIFDAGLDDRVVECLKLSLKAKQKEQFPGALYFNERRPDGALGFVHINEGRLQSFQLPGDLWSLHAQAIGDLGPPNAERWPRVDLGYALGIYERLSKRK
jgi:hypothetical protein